MRRLVRASPGRAHGRVLTAVMVAAGVLAAGQMAALTDGGPRGGSGLATGQVVADLGAAVGGAEAGTQAEAPASTGGSGGPAPVVAAPPATDGCGPGAGAVNSTGTSGAEPSGTVGALGRELAQLLCSPFGAAAGLPPTELEAEEPARLYALVNAEHPVRPITYAPDDLVAIQGGPYEARDEVVEQLDRLLAAAAEAGHTQLVVQSGFRDHDTQAGSFEDWVRRVGEERAELVSARAGHSEHQLGLAVDVTGPCGFGCTGETADEQWVADNAHRFGFVVRYPEGGEDVTGYGYEPWHLRYVGPRAAWGMRLQGEIYWERFAAVALEAAEDVGT